MSAKTAVRRFRRVPRVTLGLAIATIAIHASGIGPDLLYQRSNILHGAIWRAWTGHFVHFNLSHLFWNLCVFIPAGGWFELIHPRAARWFYLLSPVFISAVLLAAEPGLLAYGGLSGVATGILVCLACSQVGTQSSSPAWFWWGVLVIVAAKITVESVSGQAMLVTGIRDVPLAHVAGAAVGVIFGLAARRGGGAERHAG
ncbi:MAG TPA: rhombosortase [Candidatus Didemnitutus sp.]